MSEQRARDDALRARGNLTIPLTPEMPEDRRVAEVALKMAKVKCEYSRDFDALIFWIVARAWIRIMCGSIVYKYCIYHYSMSTV